MSTLAIVLVVIAAVLVVLFVGGIAASARRRRDADDAIARADRALADALAHDRGWDPSLLAGAASQALAEQRPDFQWQRLDLVLVDDRPGVAEDRCHMRASGTAGDALVVLARNERGEWAAERVE